jgi:hypothetical protein
MIEKVKVSCFTNLDEEAKLTWPTVFACRPEKGDAVMSVCGKRVLKIHAITHVCPEQKLGERDAEPFLRVELHR